MEASMKPSSAMLGAALELSKLAPVFPCKGKRPLTDHGYKDASTDASTIGQAWTRNPDANVGLVTGSLIVVDVDGPEGAKSLEALEAQHEPLAPTLSASTGRGVHRYYRCPEGVTIGNSAGKLGVGLDVRGKGGYVIAPPSVHASGKRYEWIAEGVPIAELPEWIAELLKPRERQQGDVVAIRPTGDADQRYALSALESEAQSVRVAPDGTRNHTLNTAAYNLGQLVANGSITESEVVEQLTAAAQAASLPDHEIERTLSSGLKAGLLNPRGPLAPSKALEKGKPASLPAPRPSTLPEIVITGRANRDLTADALSALKAANDKSPRVFVQNGRLSRVRSGEDRAKIETLSEDALRGELDRCADWQRADRSGFTPTAVPLSVVKDLLSLDGHLGLPQIDGVVECPVMRPDGSILTARGYDAATRLYYHPRAGLELPEIADKPTAKDVKAALDTLLEPIAEIPFSSDADRANALGYILTPLVRPMISGHIPLALVEATRSGTGKNLLAEVAARISTGGEADTTPAPNKPEELDKLLGALLIEGASTIVLDEVQALGSSAFLNSLLTMSQARVRILGQSATARVPNRAVVAALGNNVDIRGDFVRRYYPIRLDAKSATPFANRTFTIEHLEDWTLEHRGELVAAVLTLARAWHVAGRKGKPHKRLGSYEGFTSVIGGILANAGESHFLENVEQAQTEADDQGLELEAFLDAIAERLGIGNSFTIKELNLKIKEDQGLRDSMPTALSAADEKALPQKLGGLLKRSKDTRVGDSLRRFEKVGTDSNSKAALWAVAEDRVVSE